MLGLVLSGGGARGLAHIGVLEVLEVQPTPPQVIAGTSMGAIVGAFWAAGYTAPEILQIARKTPWLSMIDFSPTLRLISPKKLDRYLRGYLPASFGELHRKLVVAVVNLVTGKVIYLHEGDLVSAVVASAGIPGAIGPVEREGMLLVDGGILDNLPVVGARFLGADQVIAVDVTPPGHTDPADRALHNPLGQARQVIRIMQERITQFRWAAHPPEVYLRPELPGIGIESFDRLEEIVEAGRRSARGMYSVEAESGLEPSEGHA